MDFCLDFSIQLAAYLFLYILIISLGAGMKTRVKRIKNEVPAWSWLFRYG